MRDLKNNHFTEVSKNEFKDLLDDNPNDTPFTCELHGYILVAINQDITFIAYPNGERKELQQAEKTLLFENQRFALTVFHYEVEKERLLRDES